MGNNASQIDTEGRRNSDGLSKAGSSRFGFRKNRAQPAANGTSDDDNDGSTDRSSFDQASEILGTLDASYVINFQNIRLEGPPIACGGSGQVYKAKLNGAVVAVKALYSQLMTGNIDELKHEVGMIARARCPNIISFYGVSHSQGITYIVTEFCPLSLAGEIVKRTFDGKAYSSIAVQVLRGIAYLHATGVAHRDVKPPNVLLQSDGAVKLCDLGMSKFTDRMMTMNAGIVGSPSYMPPEAFLDLRHSGSGTRTPSLHGKAWDIYSLGVLFWWMWHNQEPFASMDNIFAIANIVQKGARPAWFGYPVTGPDGCEEAVMEIKVEATAEGDGGLPRSSSSSGVAPKALVELVHCMWSHDSTQRPSAEECLERFEAHIAPVLIPLPHDALYRSRGDGEEEAEPGINYPFPTADNSGSNNGNGKSDSSSSSSSKPARRRSMLTPPPVPFAPPSPPPAAATTSDDQLHPPSSCSSAPRVFFPPLPPPAQPALASPRSSHQPANGTLSVAVADPEGGIKLTQEAPRAGVKLEGVRVDEHGTSLHVDAGSEQEGEQGLDPHEVPAETQSNTANSAAEVPSLAHEARTTSSALPPPTPASDAGPSVREVASGEAAKGEGEMLLVGGSPPLPLEAPNSASVEEEEEVWNEESARSWLRSVLIGASSQGSHSFESPHLLDDLRDGTALCDLLNVLLEAKAGQGGISAEVYSQAMLKTVHRSKLGIKQMENISSFIRTCRALNIGGGDRDTSAGHPNITLIVDRANLTEERGRSSSASPSVLFEMAHLRSAPPSPEGLGRVLTTLRFLRRDLSVANLPFPAGADTK